MLKPGDIILISGINIISRLMRWFTKSKYSHVVMYIGDGHIIESSAGGVQRDLLSKYNKSKKIVIRPIYQGEESTFILWVLEGMIGHRYDYGFIFGYPIALLADKLGIHIKNPLGSDYSYVCSEMVARALTIVSPRFDVRKLAIDKDYDLVVPQDFVDALQKMPDVYMQVAWESNNV